jgi:flagellar biosynthesis protein FlhF
MSEALRAVRHSLGPDALILTTRNVAAGDGMAVEVTALADGPEPEAAIPEQVSERDRPAAEPIDGVRQEIAALRSMLCWLAPGLTHQSEILKTLVAQGLSPEIIARVSAAMKSVAGSDDRTKVFHLLSQLVSSGGQVRGDGERECLALVGPTGVGKTTTVVKLTVFESQRRDCRVGWVSTENHRVAGNDPLAVYAGILGVKYETAANRKELKRALDRLADCDLVLVDTPGVSPRDQENIDDLEKLLRGVPNLKRVLLLSAVTNGRDMTDCVKIYGRSGLDSLLFTKLDESRHFGPLINTASTSGRPVSYITLGQNIAGDLEIATPQALASLLLTGVDSHD